LAELGAVEMYVIHKMRFVVVFSFGNQLGRKNPPFCVIFTQNMTSPFDENAA
jgi:hypothetical protein